MRRIIIIAADQKDAANAWLAANVGPECAETFTNPLYDDTGLLKGNWCSWAMGDALAAKIDAHFGAPVKPTIIAEKLATGTDVDDTGKVVVIDPKAKLATKVYASLTADVVKQVASLTDVNAKAVAEPVEEKPLEEKPAKELGNLGGAKELP